MASKFRPIAVVGVSALFPGSPNAQGFWRDILAGRDLITDVPPSRWLIEDHYDPDPKAPDKTYCKRGGFLSPVDFDPMEFGVPPTALPATDTCQLLALIVAKKVLEDAVQGQFKEIDRDRASVILGVTSGQELFLEVASRLQRPVWVNAMREQGFSEAEIKSICDRISGSYVPWQESTFPGLLGNVVAGRIANRFNLGGTNCVTDAACASSLSALKMGVDELQLGHSDLVISGGVDTFNDVSMFVCFSKTPALSLTGDCRPFSDRADGTILGEGLAMFALKRLDDAERDGNRIYSVIQGIGSSSDGRSKSIYAPVSEGQAKAMRRTYEAAGYSPETVELAEAHGTGTTAGDKAEFQSLKTVFEEANSKLKQWCALGTVKSQIGHTKATAGAASLFKTVMALHHRVLPPTIKVDRPNPALEIEQSPFYLNTQARPWIRPADHPRRASMSSFGFGGTNFHVTLEEYNGPAEQPKPWWNSPSELVLIAAESASALADSCRKMANEAAASVQKLALASQMAFDAALPHRLAVVCDDRTELVRKLQSAAADPAKPVPGVYYSGDAAKGKVAFLFPGQGSQYPNMSAQLSMVFEAAREMWDQATTAVEDLAKTAFPIPVFSDAEREAQVRQLTATEWAQPSIGAASAALLAVLSTMGVTPDCVAGHSFGELSALYAAQSIDLTTLIQLARKRGELMASASEAPGAMLSVKCESGDLRHLTSEWGLDLVVANQNSPQQSVLSGTVEAIAEAEKRLAALNIRTMKLGVSTAFHSPLVAPAAEAFHEALEHAAIGLPKVPVYSNANGEPYPTELEALRTQLARQIARPVLFQQMIERMHADGVRTFIEVGPGGVLTGLVKATLGEHQYQAITLDRAGSPGMTALWHGLGQMAVLGIPMNWTALRAEHALAPEPETNDKGRLLVKVDGGNIGRPYPATKGTKTMARVAPPPAIVAAPPPTPPPISPAPATVAKEVPVIKMSRPLPAAPAAPQIETPKELDAYKTFQEAISEAHRNWQSNLAKGHESFLRTMESAYFAALGSAPPVSTAPVSRAAISAPPVHSAPAPAPPPVYVAPPPVYVAPAAPAVVAAAPPPPPPAPVVPVAVAKTAAPSKPGVDLRAELLSVVAEKTGYPTEMLEPSMALEADLGIDSIKRVEILSSLQERVPGLPELDPSEVGTMRTLADIIARLDTAPPAASAPAVVTAVAAAPKAASAGVDLRAALLSVVAEKTGYPTEMLEPSMALEADLGIDSIKRVEILSALQERVPGLPELDPSEVGTMRTLADIIARLDSAPAAAVTVASVSAGPTAAAAPAVPNADLSAALLSVVAEKTGYPTEMLEPSMALEADLGIDSIKRVEILSALQERVPGLPELDPSQLGTLRTLADILAHLGAGGGAPLEKAEVFPTQAAVRKGLRRTLAIRPAVAIGHCMIDSAASTIYLVDDGRGIATALAAQFAEHGETAKVVDQVPADASTVLFLGGLLAVASVDEALDLNRQAFETARTVAKQISANGGVFVTVQDTGGQFAPADGLRAWSGGLPGLVKTATHEWPKVRAKAIDVEIGERSPDAVAKAILSEILLGGPELEVGLTASGGRFTLETVLSDEPEGPAHGVAPGSVVLVSGGGRGVTATSVIELARRVKLRVALLGRSPLADEPAFCAGIGDELALRKAILADAQSRGEKLAPAKLQARGAQILAAREIRDTMRQLEQAGSQVKYFGLDVRDAQALNKVLAEIRTAWGPIQGIVHGAGVLADKRIEELTAEQYESVFSTKVLGLQALLAATANDPLRLLTMFSSISARCGNAGQAAYAMANEVLNKVAQAESVRRGAACQVKSLNWGPWDGGMVTPALRRHFEAMGVPVLSLEDGTGLFANELTLANTSNVEVVMGGAIPMPGREVRYRIDGHSHPFLSDHTIQDLPVLPAVEALELFLRAAEASGTSDGPMVCTDLKVLRGVMLNGFEGSGNLLTVRPRSGEVWELVGADGTRHYEATLRPAREAMKSLVDRGSIEQSLSPVPWKEADVYGKLLFHGPAFQVVQAVSGVSKQGIAGTLTGIHERQWLNGNRCSDGAMLDGGLQLARLWGYHTLGKPTLPMKIGAVRVQNHRAADGLVSCRVNGSAVGNAKIVCDIDFYSDQQELLATMTGVEMYATAGA